MTPLYHACLLLLLGAEPTTVDAQIRQGVQDGTLTVTEVRGQRTQEVCNRAKNVTILSTTDGEVALGKDETKYFRIKPVDPFTKAGGWYWKCGTSLQWTILEGSEVVKAVRGPTGVEWRQVAVTKK